jgi:hypothetical protein
VVPGQQDHRDLYALQRLAGPQDRLPLDLVVLEDIPGDHHEGRPGLGRDVTDPHHGIEPRLGEPGLPVRPEEPAHHAQLPVGTVQEGDRVVHSGQNASPPHRQNTSQHTRELHNNHHSTIRAPARWLHPCTASLAILPERDAFELCDFEHRPVSRRRTQWPSRAQSREDVLPCGPADGSLVTKAPGGAMAVDSHEGEGDSRW